MSSRGRFVLAMLSLGICLLFIVQLLYITIEEREIRARFHEITNVVINANVTVQSDQEVHAAIGSQVTNITASSESTKVDSNNVSFSGNVLLFLASTPHTLSSIVQFSLSSLVTISNIAQKYFG